jgi:hypothetical protein
MFVDEERDGTALTLDQRYLPIVRERELQILKATEQFALRTPAGRGMADAGRGKSPPRRLLSRWISGRAPCPNDDTRGPG